MNWAKLTKLISVVLLIFIGVYDVVAIIKGGSESSFSFLIIDLSYKFPAFTFFSGFTMGHLFWRMKGIKNID